MYYEINVSKAGRHLFATHARSCQNDAEARKVYRVIVEKFPKAEGYNVTVLCHEEIGTILHWENKNV